MVKALAAEALNNLVIGSFIVLNSDYKVQNARSRLASRDFSSGLKIVITQRGRRVTVRTPSTTVFLLIWRAWEISTPLRLILYLEASLSIKISYFAQARVKGEVFHPLFLEEHHNVVMIRLCFRLDLQPFPIIIKGHQTADLGHDSINKCSLNDLDFSHYRWHFPDLSC